MRSSILPVHEQTHLSDTPANEARVNHAPQQKSFLMLWNEVNSPSGQNVVTQLANGTLINTSTASREAALPAAETSEVDVDNTQMRQGEILTTALGFLKSSEPSTLGRLEAEEESVQQRQWVDAAFADYFDMLRAGGDPEAIFQEFATLNQAIRTLRRTGNNNTAEFLEIITARWDMLLNFAIELPGVDPVMIAKYFDEGNLEELGLHTVNATLTPQQQLEHLGTSHPDVKSQLSNDLAESQQEILARVTGMDTAATLMVDNAEILRNIIEIGSKAEGELGVEGVTAIWEMMKNSATPDIFRNMDPLFSDTSQPEYKQTRDQLSQELSKMYRRADFAAALRSGVEGMIQQLAQDRNVNSALTGKIDRFLELALAQKSAPALIVKPSGWYQRFVNNFRQAKAKMSEKFIPSIDKLRSDPVSLADEAIRALFSDASVWKGEGADGVDMQSLHREIITELVGEASNKATEMRIAAEDSTVGTNAQTDETVRAKLERSKEIKDRLFPGAQFEIQIVGAGVGGSIAEGTETYKQQEGLALLYDKYIHSPWALRTISFVRLAAEAAEIGAAGYKAVDELIPGDHSLGHTPRHEMSSLVQNDHEKDHPLRQVALEHSKPEPEPLPTAAASTADDTPVLRAHEPLPTATAAEEHSGAGGKPLYMVRGGTGSAETTALDPVVIPDVPADMTVSQVEFTSEHHVAIGHSGATMEGLLNEIGITHNQDIYDDHVATDLQEHGFVVVASGESAETQTHTLIVAVDSQGHLVHDRHAGANDTLLRIDLDSTVDVSDPEAIQQALSAAGHAIQVTDNLETPAFHNAFTQELHHLQAVAEDKAAAQDEHMATVTADPKNDTLAKPGAQGGHDEGAPQAPDNDHDGRRDAYEVQVTFADGHTEEVDAGDQIWGGWRIGNTYTIPADFADLGNEAAIELPPGEIGLFNAIVAYNSTHPGAELPTTLAQQILDNPDLAREFVGYNSNHEVIDPATGNMVTVNNWLAPVEFATGAREFGTGSEADELAPAPSLPTTTPYTGTPATEALSSTIHNVTINDTDTVQIAAGSETNSLWAGLQQFGMTNADVAEVSADLQEHGVAYVTEGSNASMIVAVKQIEGTWQVVEPHTKTGVDGVTLVHIDLPDGFDPHLQAAGGQNLIAAFEEDMNNGAHTIESLKNAVGAAVTPTGSGAPTGGATPETEVITTEVLVPSNEALVYANQPIDVVADRLAQQVNEHINIPARAVSQTIIDIADGIAPEIADDGVALVTINLNGDEYMTANEQFLVISASPDISTDGEVSWTREAGTKTIVFVPVSELELAGTETQAELESKADNWLSTHQNEVTPPALHVNSATAFPGDTIQIQEMNSEEMVIAAFENPNHPGITLVYDENTNEHGVLVHVKITNDPTSGPQYEIVDESFSSTDVMGVTDSIIFIPENKLAISESALLEGELTQLPPEDLNNLIDSHLSGIELVQVDTEVFLSDTRSIDINENIFVTGNEYSAHTPYYYIMSSNISVSTNRTAANYNYNYNEDFGFATVTLDNNETWALFEVDENGHRTYSGYAPAGSLPEGHRTVAINITTMLGEDGNASSDETVTYLDQQLVIHHDSIVGVLEGAVSQEVEGSGAPDQVVDNWTADNWQGDPIFFDALQNSAGELDINALQAAIPTGGLPTDTAHNNVILIPIDDNGDNDPDRLVAVAFLDDATNQPLVGMIKEADGSISFIAEGDYEAEVRMVIVEDEVPIANGAIDYSALDTTVEAALEAAATPAEPGITYTPVSADPASTNALVTTDGQVNVAALAAAGVTDQAAIDAIENLLESTGGDQYLEATVAVVSAYSVNLNEGEEDGYFVTKEMFRDTIIPAISDPSKTIVIKSDEGGRYIDVIPSGQDIYDLIQISSRYNNGNAIEFSGAYRVRLDENGNLALIQVDGGYILGDADDNGTEDTNVQVTIGEQVYQFDNTVNANVRTIYLHEDGSVAQVYAVEGQTLKTDADNILNVNGQPVEMQGVEDANVWCFMLNETGSVTRIYAIQGETLSSNPGNPLRINDQSIALQGVEDANIWSLELNGDGGVFRIYARANASLNLGTVVINDMQISITNLNGQAVEWIEFNEDGTIATATLIGEEAPMADTSALEVSVSPVNEGESVVTVTPENAAATATSEPSPTPLPPTQTPSPAPTEVAETNTPVVPTNTTTATATATPTYVPTTEAAEAEATEISPEQQLGDMNLTPVAVNFADNAQEGIANGSFHYAHSGTVSAGSYLHGLGLNDQEQQAALARIEDNEGWTLVQTDTGEFRLITAFSVGDSAAALTTLGTDRNGVVNAAVSIVTIPQELVENGHLSEETISTILTNQLENVQGINVTAQPAAFEAALKAGATDAVTEVLATYHQPNVADTVIVNSSETIAEQLYKQNQISRSEVSGFLDQLQENGGWAFDDNGDLVMIIGKQGELMTGAGDLVVDEFEGVDLPDISSAMIVTVSGVNQAEFNEAQLPWILEQIESEEIYSKRIEQDTIGALSAAISVMAGSIGFLVYDHYKRDDKAFDAIASALEKVTSPREIYQAFTRLASYFPEQGTKAWNALSKKLSQWRKPGNSRVSMTDKEINDEIRYQRFQLGLSEKLAYGRQIASKLLNDIASTSSTELRLHLFATLRRAISPTQMKPADRVTMIGVSRQIGEELAQLPPTNDLTDEQQNYLTQLLSEDDETPAYAGSLSESLIDAHVKSVQELSITNVVVDVMSNLPGALTPEVSANKLRGAEWAYFNGDVRHKGEDIPAKTFRKLMFRALTPEYMQTKSRLGKAKFDLDKAIAVFGLMYDLAETDFKDDPKKREKAEAHVLANLDGVSLVQFTEEFIRQDESDPLAIKLKQELERRISNLQSNIERKLNVDPNAPYEVGVTAIGDRPSMWEITSAIHALQCIQNDSQIIRARLGASSGLGVLAEIAQGANAYRPDRYQLPKVPGVQYDQAKADALQAEGTAIKERLAAEYLEWQEIYDPNGIDVSSYTKEAKLEQLEGVLGRLKSKHDAETDETKKESYFRQYNLVASEIKAVKGRGKRAKEAILSSADTMADSFDSKLTAIRNKFWSNLAGLKGEKLQQARVKAARLDYGVSHPDIKNIGKARAWYGDEGVAAMYELHFADHPLNLAESPAAALIVLKKVEADLDKLPAETLAQAATLIPHVVFNAIGRNGVDEVAKVALMSNVVTKLFANADILGGSKNKTLDELKDNLIADERKAKIKAVYEQLTKVLVPGQLTASAVVDGDYPGMIELIDARLIEMRGYVSTVLAAKKAINESSYHPRTLLRNYDGREIVSGNLTENDTQILNQIKQRIIFESMIAANDERASDTMIFTTLDTLHQNLNDGRGDKREMLRYTNMESARLLAGELNDYTPAEEISSAAEQEVTKRKANLQAYLDGAILIPDEITLETADHLILNSSYNPALIVLCAEFIQKYNAASKQAGAVSIFSEVTIKTAKEILEVPLQPDSAAEADPAELAAIFAPHPEADSEGYDLDLAQAVPVQVEYPEEKLLQALDRATNPDTSDMQYRTHVSSGYTLRLEASGQMKLGMVGEYPVDYKGQLNDVAVAEFSSSGEHIIVRHTGEANKDKLMIYAVEDLLKDQKDDEHQPASKEVAINLQDNGWRISAGNDGRIFVYADNSLQEIQLGEEGEIQVGQVETIITDTEDAKTTKVARVTSLNGKRETLGAHVSQNGEEHKWSFTPDGRYVLINRENKIFLFDREGTEKSLIDLSEKAENRTGLYIDYARDEQDNAIGVRVAWSEADKVKTLLLQNKAEGGGAAPATGVTGATPTPQKVPTQLEPAQPVVVPGEQVVVETQGTSAAEAPALPETNEYGYREATPEEINRLSVEIKIGGQSRRVFLDDKHYDHATGTYLNVMRTNNASTVSVWRRNDQGEFIRLTDRFGVSTIQDAVVVADPTDVDNPGIAILNGNKLFMHKVRLEGNKVIVDKKGEVKISKLSTKRTLDMRENFSLHKASNGSLLVLSSFFTTGRHKNQSGILVQRVTNLATDPVLEQHDLSKLSLGGLTEEVDMVGDTIICKQQSQNELMGYRNVALVNVVKKTGVLGKRSNEYKLDQELKSVSGFEIRGDLAYILQYRMNQVSQSSRVHQVERNIRTRKLNTTTAEPDITLVEDQITFEQAQNQILHVVDDNSNQYLTLESTTAGTVQAWTKAATPAMPAPTESAKPGSIEIAPANLVETSIGKVYVGDVEHQERDTERIIAAADITAKLWDNVGSALSTDPPRAKLAYYGATNVHWLDKNQGIPGEFTAENLDGYLPKGAPGASKEAWIQDWFRTKESANMPTSMETESKMYLILGEENDGKKLLRIYANYKIKTRQPFPGTMLVEMDSSLANDVQAAAMENPYVAELLLQQMWMAMGDAKDPEDLAHRGCRHTLAKELVIVDLQDRTDPLTKREMAGLPGIPFSQEKAEEAEEQVAANARTICKEAVSVTNVREFKDVTFEKQLTANAGGMIALSTGVIAKGDRGIVGTPEGTVALGTDAEGFSMKFTVTNSNLIIIKKGEIHEHVIYLSQDINIQLDIPDLNAVRAVVSKETKQGEPDQAQELIEILSTQAQNQLLTPDELISIHNQLVVNKLENKDQKFEFVKILQNLTQRLASAGKADADPNFQAILLKLGLLIKDVDENGQVIGVYPDPVRALQAMILMGTQASDQTAHAPVAVGGRPLPSGEPGPKGPQPPEPEPTPNTEATTEVDPLADQKAKIAKTLNGIIDGQEFRLVGIQENEFPAEPTRLDKAETIKPIEMRNGDTITFPHEKWKPINQLKVTKQDGNEIELTLEEGDQFDSFAYDPWTGKMFALIEHTTTTIDSSRELVEVIERNGNVELRVIDTHTDLIFLGEIGNNSLTYTKAKGGDFEKRIYLNNKSLIDDDHGRGVTWSNMRVRMSNDWANPTLNIRRDIEQDDKFITEKQIDLLESINGKLPDLGRSEKYIPEKMVINTDGEIYLKVRHSKRPTNVNLYFKLELATGKQEGVGETVEPQLTVTRDSDKTAASHYQSEPSIQTVTNPAFTEFQLTYAKTTLDSGGNKVLIGNELKVNTPQQAEAIMNVTDAGLKLQVDGNITVYAPKLQISNAIVSGHVSGLYGSVSVGTGVICKGYAGVYSNKTISLVSKSEDGGSVMLEFLGNKENEIVLQENKIADSALKRGLILHYKPATDNDVVAQVNYKDQLGSILPKESLDSVRGLLLKGQQPEGNVKLESDDAHEFTGILKTLTENLAEAAKIDDEGRTQLIEQGLLLKDIDADGKVGIYPDPVAALKVLLQAAQTVNAETTPAPAGGATLPVGAAIPGNAPGSGEPSPPGKEPSQNPEAATEADPLAEARKEMRKTLAKLLSGDAAKVTRVENPDIIKRKLSGDQRTRVDDHASFDVAPDGQSITVHDSNSNQKEHIYLPGSVMMQDTFFDPWEKAVLYINDEGTISKIGLDGKEQNVLKLPFASIQAVGGGTVRARSSSNKLFMLTHEGGALELGPSQSFLNSELGDKNIGIFEQFVFVTDGQLAVIAQDGSIHKNPNSLNASPLCAVALGVDESTIEIVDHLINPDGIFAGVKIQGQDGIQYFKLELAEEPTVEAPKPVIFDLADYADNRETVINTALPVVKTTQAKKDVDYTEVQNGARIDVLVEGSGVKRGTSEIVYSWVQASRQFKTVINLEEHSIVVPGMRSAVILPNGRGAVNVNDKNGLDFSSLNEDELKTQTLDLQLSENEQPTQVNVAPDGTVSVVVRKTERQNEKHYLKVITTDASGSLQVETWDSERIIKLNGTAYRPTSATTGYLVSDGAIYYVAKQKQEDGSVGFQMAKVNLTKDSYDVANSVHLGNGNYATQAINDNGKIHVLSGASAKAIALPDGTLGEGDMINNLGADLSSDPPALLVDIEGKNNSGHKVVRIEFAEIAPEPVKFNLAAHKAPETEGAIDISKPRVVATKATRRFTGTKFNRYGTKIERDGNHEIIIGGIVSNKIDYKNAVVMPDGQAVAAVTTERDLVIVAKQGEGLTEHKKMLTLDYAKGEFPEIIEVAPDGTLGIVITENRITQKRVATVITNDKGELEQVDWDVKDSVTDNITNFYPASATTGYLRTEEQLYYVERTETDGQAKFAVHLIASGTGLKNLIVHIGNEKFATHDDAGDIYVLDKSNARKVVLPKNLKVRNMGADLGSTSPALYVSDSSLETYRIEFADEAETKPETEKVIPLPPALSAETEFLKTNKRIGLNPVLLNAEATSARIAKTEDLAAFMIPGSNYHLAAGSRQVNSKWKTAIQKGQTEHQIIYSHPASEGEHEITFGEDVSVMDTFASPFSPTLYALTSDGKLHIILPNLSYDPSKVGEKGDVLADYGTETFQDEIKLADKFAEGAKVSIGMDGRIYVSNFDVETGKTEIITLDRELKSRRMKVTKTSRQSKIEQIEPAFMNMNGSRKSVYYVNENGYLRVYSSLEDNVAQALYTSSVAQLGSNVEFRVDDKGKVVFMKQGQVYIVEPKETDGNKGFTVVKNIDLREYSPSSINFGLTTKGQIAFLDIKSQQVHVIEAEQETKKKTEVLVLSAYAAEPIPAMNLEGSLEIIPSDEASSTANEVPLNPKYFRRGSRIVNETSVEFALPAEEGKVPEKVQLSFEKATDVAMLPNGQGIVTIQGNQVIVQTLDAQKRELVKHDPINVELNVGESLESLYMADNGEIVVQSTTDDNKSNLIRIKSSGDKEHLITDIIREYTTIGQDNTLVWIKGYPDSFQLSLCSKTGNDEVQKHWILSDIRTYGELVPLGDNLLAVRTGSNAIEIYDLKKQEVVSTIENYRQQAIGYDPSAQELILAINEGSDTVYKRVRFEQSGVGETRPAAAEPEPLMKPTGDGKRKKKKLSLD